MALRRRSGAQDGQATVEWVGLVLLVALLAVALATAAGARLPGTAMARTIAERIACAAGLGATGCGGPPDPGLAAAYGSELAALVRRQAPTLSYEEGMRAVPVDFRTCREDACSMGDESGEVLASLAGEPVTLFVHVIDCRPGETTARDDCSGERAGRLYLQFWAYYPGSQSLRSLPGDVGHHPDDWESLQIRLGPGGREARASSHHGYNHGGGAANWLSDAGVSERPAWGQWAGRYYVSGGSHAGHAWEPAGRLARRTPGALVRLIPFEEIARRWDRARFAVTPPWLKRVYHDPEYTGTD